MLWLLLLFVFITDEIATRHSSVFCIMRGYRNRDGGGDLCQKHWPSTEQPSDHVVPRSKGVTTTCIHRRGKKTSQKRWQTKLYKAEWTHSSGEQRKQANWLLRDERLRGLHQMHPHFRHSTVVPFKLSILLTRKQNSFLFSHEKKKNDFINIRNM